MGLDETEMRLPGSHRHVFQGDQGDATDVHRTKGRRMMYFQETIHFLRDFSCQLGFGDRGRFAPPVLRSHLCR